MPAVWVSELTLSNVSLIPVNHHHPYGHKYPVYIVQPVDIPCRLAWAFTCKSVGSFIQSPDGHATEVPLGSNTVCALVEGVPLSVVAGAQTSITVEMRTITCFGKITDGLFKSEGPPWATAQHVGVRHRLLQFRDKNTFRCSSPCPQKSSPLQPTHTASSRTC